MPPKKKPGAAAGAGSPAPKKKKPIDGSVFGPGMPSKATVNKIKKNSPGRMW